jgi:hypothetical protein
MIEIEREICVNEEHSEKQYSPSKVIESGISIDSILKLLKKTVNTLFPNE